MTEDDLAQMTLGAAAEYIAGCALNGEVDTSTGECTANKKVLLDLANEGKENPANGTQELDNIATFERNINELPTFQYQALMKMHVVATMQLTRLINARGIMQKGDVRINPQSALLNAGETFLTNNPKQTPGVVVILDPIVERTTFLRYDCDESSGSVPDDGSDGSDGNDGSDDNGGTSGDNENEPAPVALSRGKAAAEANSKSQAQVKDTSAAVPVGEAKAKAQAKTKKAERFFLLLPIKVVGIRVLPRRRNKNKDIFVSGL